MGRTSLRWGSPSALVRPGAGPALYRPVLDSATAAAFSPSTVANVDSAISCGFQFQVTTGCTLQAIRWLQGSSGGVDTSSRQGAVYTTTDGTTIATTVAVATAAAPVGSGWQSLALSGGSVALGPGVTYVASVYHPAGGYCADGHYFDATGPVTSNFTDGPITLLSAANALAGIQGGFRSAVGLDIPNTVFNAGNYWTDVEIVP